MGVTGVVLLGLAAGWAGRPTEPSAWQLAGVMALTGAAVTWIRTGRRGQRVETVGPWLLLAVVALSVVATGGAASPYTPLALPVLGYAAVFTSTRVFAALFVAAAGVAVGPALATGSAAGVAGAAVTTVTWLAVAVFVHRLVRRLDNAAQTDGLTGLWNHAAFWRRLHAEDARARRTASPYSVLMIDVDHFKQLNDRHGHQAGDAVLKRMADILANRIRGSDVLARYGGEEFAVLLPDTPQAAAADVAEKLRRLLSVASISVSIGVADNADLQASPDEVVGAADAALYDAKLAGRARVRTAPAAHVIDLPAGQRRVAGSPR